MPANVKTKKYRDYLHELKEYLAAFLTRSQPLVDTKSTLEGAHEEVIYIYMCVCVCVCVYIYIYIRIFNIYIYKCTYIQKIYVYICICIYIYIYMYIYVFRNIYKHIYI